MLRRYRSIRWRRNAQSSPIRPSSPTTGSSWPPTSRRSPEPRGLAVLAHPHPRYGGSRHVHMIEAWFQALPAAGLTTIRFDFRGGGASGGSHTGGEREPLDVSAAIAALPGTEELPLLVAGWSFGAEILLAHPAPEIAAWVAVAPPASQRPTGNSGRRRPAAHSDPGPRARPVRSPRQWPEPRPMAGSPPRSRPSRAPTTP